MEPISIRDILKDAQKNNYAIAAINANGATYDIARAILEGANEEKVPVIIQAYEHNMEYRGYEYFVMMVRHLARDMQVPFAINLDHGTESKTIMTAVRAGFTGVMIDNSNTSLDENISRTNELLKFMRPIGVSVEAEVGHMAQQEHLERGTSKTAVADVKKFLAAVDVDTLAISVGTSHGIHERQDAIDFDLIRQVRKMTEVPLVMHGTCGVSLENVSNAARAGMRKINFGEGIRMNYIRYFNETTQSLNHQGHVWKIMRAVKDQLKGDIRNIIRACALKA